MFCPVSIRSSGSAGARVCLYFSGGRVIVSDPIPLAWDVLFRAAAGPWDTQVIAVVGWPIPFGEDGGDRFLIVPEPACCGGCATADPFACIEAFAADSSAWSWHRQRFIGRLVCLDGDESGFSYRLRDVRAVPAPEVESPFVLTRRQLVFSAGLALTLAACAPERGMPSNGRSGAADALLERTVSVDIHSHAGAILRETSPLHPVADPMRKGLMSTICLAMVADRGTTRVTTDKRIEVFREPDAGELYQRSRGSFGRIQQLIESDGLRVIRAPTDLRPAGRREPGVIVSAEGADFLDEDLDRLDEAFLHYDLRLLQLTHYRVNSLGDIQTAPPVHGGLTAFGSDVIRRCNRLGIVVDVAHGPFDLVKRAAAVSDRPLILSHTSLAAVPPARSRRISDEHARVIAATGGVIGIWPPMSIFPDIEAYARGIARMVDVVGVDHVGLGSDQLGLTVPSVFGDYEKLPDVASALFAVGFHADEAAKILGGNFVRVFGQTVRSV